MSTHALLVTTTTQLLEDAPIVILTVRLAQMEPPLHVLHVLPTSFKLPPPLVQSTV